ncbi:hypothetical protein cce_3097 [Crocosphaera subtropica ATCC 51142]|uniref:Uncharacterized protein n=1 Tax=Crocosphaera subtropica (strain ATCC 51142 / BH68) TaxID=43989 RepID=B1WWX6_CROS5|nr:hypothetical protein cce_3097 [Crocosphaera subtropica ATCC 51142]
MSETTKQLSASFYPHLEEIKSGSKILLMIE